MRGGRGRLPVLAEISGSAPGESRVWSLRREDLRALAELQGSLGDGRVVLLSGEESLTGAIALASATRSDWAGVSVSGRKSARLSIRSVVRISSTFRRRSAEESPWSFSG